MTGVRDQLNCTACYAITAAETVESSYCINHGTLYTLSAQQIVDCSTSSGNQGCNGGYYFFAWTYLQTNGLEEASEYPYTGVVDKCVYDASLGKVKTTSEGTKVAATSTAIMTAINA